MKSSVLGLECEWGLCALTFLLNMYFWFQYNVDLERRKYYLSSNFKEFKQSEWNSRKKNCPGNNFKIFVTQQSIKQWKDDLFAFNLRFFLKFNQNDGIFEKLIVIVLKKKPVIAINRVVKSLLDLDLGGVKNYRQQKKTFHIEG